MEADTDVSNPSPSQSPVAETWLPELYRAADLSDDAPLNEVQDKMGNLADLSAPVARNWMVIIALIQGLAVVVPTLWLMRNLVFLTPEGTALLVLVSAAGVTMALWWIRWRGMQRTWARARLIAEVSRASATGTPSAPLDELAFLFRIPALKVLLERIKPTQEIIPRWEIERDTWIEKRLDDQLAYYASAREKAEKQRREITRLTTLVMDVMLSLALAALIFTFSDRSGEWLNLFGGRLLECFIGLVGMLLPLVVLLLQVHRFTRQLNQRTGRFARQIATLEETREAIVGEKDPDRGRTLILQAEQQMLGEVVDWYYEAETAESFFEVRDQRTKTGSGTVGRRSAKVGAKMGAVGGIGILFVLRILLGRAPWVLGTSAITLALLALKIPASPSARSELQTYGQILDSKGNAWAPVEERKEAGLIVIVHGLRDGVILNNAGDESKWMREMSAAIEGRLEENPPNIVLVNWNSQASPSKALRFQTGIASADLAADVAGIRTQAREVGDSLAFRLWQLILEEKINVDSPIQMIGHSAGGFVIGRAALRLREMGAVPDSVRITILDTPGPDSEFLEDLPSLVDMEYYVTSPFVLGLSDSEEGDPIYIRKIASEKKLNALEAHSFAHQWYNKTIREGDESENGFDRSLFANP